MYQMAWLQLDDKKYYMDENGVKLTDTITPDGYYVNINGEKLLICLVGLKTVTIGRYILKNGTMLKTAGFKTCRHRNTTIL